MRFSYRFANLCGAVYNNGNVLFSPDGNILYSPVGNRVNVFDLVNHTSYTLPFEARMNIAQIAISHSGRYLVTVDDEGRNIIVNLKKRIVLYRTNFGVPVNQIKFSPDDEYMAVTHGRIIQIWSTPSEQRHFAPMELVKEYAGHSDDITCIDWSKDGRYLVTGSLDTTVRLWSVEHFNGFESLTLSGHHEKIVGAYLSEDDKSIYSICSDGGVFEWNWNVMTDEQYEQIKLSHNPKLQKMYNEEEFHPDTETSKYYRGLWKISKKNYIEEKKSHIETCDFNHETKMLICGFSNGSFGIYTMPGCSMIHTLTISKKQLSTCAINSTGEWIAFGSSKLGQLLVWEWQSETYILKQQGHYCNINALDYSPDGSVIATGGEDSKVKLWNTNTGYCYITFKDHTASVTGVCFVKSGHALVTCSLDGTVRAFDLIRYRNFRTLTTPTPVQFTCVNVDSSGDIVAAGSMDPFNIYIWSLRTGKLLDILEGHQGPISSVSFDPRGSLLMSTSWDHSAIIWDIFGGANKEVLDHNSEVLSCSWRGDGEEACTTTLHGDIYVWDAKQSVNKTIIEGKRDITGGRRTTDNVALENIAIGKCFTSVSYSPDGQYIIAGGRSKYVCIYSLSNRMLIKKYQLSQNRSFEGILDQLNSKNMTEAGSKALLDISDNEDETDRPALPGVLNGDAAKRNVKNEIRCSTVHFSPSGETFSCATNQGLLIYSLDPSLSFEPFDIQEDITPSSITIALNNQDYSKALIYSLHLNETEYIKICLSSIPLSQVTAITNTIPRLFLVRFLQIICDQINSTPYLEYYIIWCLTIFKVHGEYIRANNRKYISVLRNVQRVLTTHYQQNQKISDQNKYLLNYLTKGSKPKADFKEEEWNEDDYKVDDDNNNDNYYDTMEIEENNNNNENENENENEKNEKDDNKKEKEESDDNNDDNNDNNSSDNTSDDNDDNTSDDNDDNTSDDNDDNTSDDNDDNTSDNNDDNSDDTSDNTSDNNDDSSSDN
ncbi:hypothetical protein WA158_004783 [Blastocystis sp. Blastoise]